MDVIFSAATHGHSEVANTLLGQMRNDYNYNQDCRNLITRLMLHKQTDVAYKALLTLNPVEQTGLYPAVRFFIPLVVTADVPSQKIVTLLSEHEELEKRGILEALELAAVKSRSELTTLLWEQLKQRKNFIPPYQFSRLLVTYCIF